MQISGYNIEWDKVKQEAQDAKRIIIRLPPGFMRYAKQIITFIQCNSKATVVLSAQQCHGSCDYPPDIFSLKDTNEKIFHLGEASMPSLSLPPSVIFFEAHSCHADIEPLLNTATQYLSGNHIGITATTPFIQEIHTCSSYLKEKGYCPLIGTKGKRAAYHGQILGCDLTAATTLQSTVHSYLHIGDGYFHPLGIALATNKPVIVIDPLLKEVKKQEITELREHILRQRMSTVARAHDADSFGIIICKKIGQNRMPLAHKLKKMLEKKEKKVTLLLLDTITPPDLDYLGIDCYISTACPRIAIDDQSLFKQPILTPLEMEILLGYKDWETYKFDQIL